MTAQELATRLNGRQYRAEISPNEEQAAKAAGLVVVFGYSDDNMELRGAIDDEVGCYDGGTFRIDREGVQPKWERGDQKDFDDAKEFFRREALPFALLTAVWDSEGYSWTYKTDLPHATFDVLEDDQPYCRGIVFAVADINQVKTT